MFLRGNPFPGRSQWNNIISMLVAPLRCCLKSMIHSKSSKQNLAFLGTIKPFCTSNHNPLLFRQYQSNSYVTSVPFRMACILPLFSFLSNACGPCRLLSTQSPADKKEVTEEELSQLLSSVENDPTSRIDVCPVYIERLCRSGNVSAASRLMRCLSDKRIFLSPKTYDIFLVAAGEIGDIDLVSQAFKDILASRQTLSSTLYLSLARAFIRTSDNISVVKFIREISELTSPRPMVINRIIYAFAKCGQTDKALLIFDHMMEHLKCRPDLITYNTILGILGSSGRIKEMVHQFACMKETGIAPDLISYNTLINSLKKEGRLDLCLAYLKEMRESSLLPDLRTYTALIDGFGSSGNIKESLRLFDEMKRSGIRPSIYVYRSLIDSLKKMGKLETALKFSEEMQSSLEDLVGPQHFKREKG